MRSKRGRFKRRAKSSIPSCIIRSKYGQTFLNLRVYIRMNPELGKIETVELREVWKDKARDCTPWLARKEYLALLSEALDLNLELENEQVAVGRFSADIVATENNLESRVIIEAQLGETDHDHLGKIITYASGLQAKVMLWIAKELTQEHKQAITFLNENGSGDLQFYAVQIELFKIGGSPPAPHFKVVASPNKYLDRVKKEQAALTAKDLLQWEFLEAFKDYCVRNRTTLILRGPTHGQPNVLRVGKRKVTYSIYLTIYAADTIGCRLRLKGKNAGRNYNILQAEKLSIEQEAGSTLEWNEQRYSITLFHCQIDLGDESKWGENFEKLKQQAEFFYQVFSNRLSRLDRSISYDPKNRNIALTGYAEVDIDDGAFEALFNRNKSYVAASVCS
jgi:Domain of unknown function (DUF4268)